MLAIVPLELKPSRTLPVPWANGLIIGLNVLSYLLLLAFGWSWTCGRGTGLASVVLYGFSHAGFWHLVGNMWALLIFGNAVNRRIGNWYYLITYLASVVIVGLLAWLLMPVGVIGASGALYAVIGMALLLLPSAQLRVGYVGIFPVTLLIALFRKPQELWQWMIRWGDFELRMLACLVVVPLLEAWGLLTSGGGVWHLGHLAGLVVGIGLVLLLPERVSMGREASLAS
jgi:membrane associated rhomboid family serine protease